MNDTTDPQAMAEAVLNVLAPKVDLPAGFIFTEGLADLRVPRILFDYEGAPVRPNDDQLRALAEQIVTAIRTAAQPAGETETGKPPRQPGTKRKLGAADILDAFRVFTGWSDEEVLHYESCGECDPFASLVCDALAVKLAGQDPEAAVTAAGKE